MVAILKMPNSFREPTGAERRVFSRREIHARIEGRRETPGQHQNPCLSLHLRDLSLGGLSAISQIALNKDESLTVFFPPQGQNRGWDAFGRVIRCEPSGFGYRVAVAFDPVPLAA